MLQCLLAGYSYYLHLLWGTHFYSVDLYGLKKTFSPDLWQLPLCCLTEHNGHWAFSHKIGIKLSYQSVLYFLNLKQLRLPLRNQMKYCLNSWANTTLWIQQCIYLYSLHLLFPFYSPLWKASVFLAHGWKHGPGCFQGSSSLCSLPLLLAASPWCIVKLSKSGTPLC